MSTMTLKEICEAVGRSESCVRQYLCRPEFADCRLKEGVSRNITQWHLNRLRQLINERRNRWIR